MRPLVFTRGEQVVQVKDSAGADLCIGHHVIDALYGEGVVIGTVPIPAGEGVNVQLVWIGETPADGPRPDNRSAEHLTIKCETPAAGSRVLNSHTGEEFMRGAVHHRNGQGYGHMHMNNTCHMHVHSA